MSDVEGLARRAADGDRFALEELAVVVRDDVYGLAMRMLRHAADAEDASQEIVIKVITHLRGFRWESAFRTWVWRVACNHLLAMRRGNAARSAAMIDSSADVDGARAAGGMAAPRQHEELLEAQVRACCANALIRSLDRDHRLTFILGELFGLRSEEGGAVLGIKPATFRKRLSRAKDRMRGYILDRCGLFNPLCRSRRCAEHRQQLAGEIARQRRPGSEAVGASHLPELCYATTAAEQPAQTDPVREMDDLVAAALGMGATASESRTDLIRRLLSSGKFHMLDA